MIKAVIFDMDGLMIDSEPIHYEAYATALKNLGEIYTLEDNNRLYIGLSDNDQAKDMVKRYALPLTPAELILRKHKEYMKLITNAIIPKPGLLKLLKNLKMKKYITAIASSSSREDIALIIHSLQISSSFDDYCSAEEVQQGKPAPDLFLLTAKRLNVSPEACLVLEDSSRGIEAAFRAGMKCFAIPSEESKDGDFTKASLKLKSLNSVYANLITQ